MQLLVLVTLPGTNNRYTINSSTPYDSGLVATAATSVAFTTSTENLTYATTVQAQCYNSAATSGWSVEGSASYYRPFSLTLTADTGGTVSGAGSYNAGTTPTITATPSAGYRFNSWTGSTGCSGVASHTITMDATKSCTASFTAQYVLTLTAGTGGTVSGAGTYDTGSTPTITATPNAYYSFSSWTGSTGCSGLSSHTITVDATKSCTANFTPTTIAAPTVPTVTVTQPTGSTTAFTWGATSCPGNTARYQYRYTISSGYDSGLVATASTSFTPTTSTEYQIYTVAVQAECYNTATASGMSTAGSGSYYRSTIPTVVIGTQTWMKYNLDVGTMINGGTAQTNNATEEKWSYSKNSDNCTIYGGLYQWNEMMQYSSTEGAQGIAPAGFHIPTDAEYTTLTTYLGGESVAGDMMKSAGICQGRTPCGTSGFDGLFGGNGYNNSWNGLGSTAGYW
jgi:uncharacterized protein (TIGR02145 family)